MNCCPPDNPNLLTVRANGLGWCPICGAEYRLEWTIEEGANLVLVTPGRTEPAELHGIRIPE